MPSTRRPTPLLLAGLALSFAAAVGARQGMPPASVTQHAHPLADVPVLALPPIDAARLLAEDAERTKAAPGPLRFAEPIDVVATLETDGAWETLADGSALWRLRVFVPNATDLNFAFWPLSLPEGATLHAIAEGRKEYAGPFGATDIHDGQLWTPVIPGDRAVLELHVPGTAKGAPGLQLMRVNAGYRDLFHLLDPPAVPASGACNNDVVCPVGDPWRAEIDSAALYSYSGSMACSGTLIMDVPRDFRPFFLTADHCGLRSGDAPSMIVYWNFQSTICGPGNDGVLADSTSGATFRATYRQSDFTLVELAAQPDPVYNVYWAGWDPTDAIPPGSVGIHHPNLDEKAITFNTDPLAYDSSCIGGGADTHWFIAQYEDGTTEPGSSGSGLWDSASHCLIGTLSGGNASCTLIDYDCYGRFAKHWIGGGTAATRLSDWLDPAGTNPTACVAGSYARGSLALSSMTIADTCGLGGGDNNHVAEPGETVELHVSLTASGSGPFTGVTGTLIALSPGVTVLDGSVTWPDFAPGTLRLSDAPHLTILLDRSVPCFGTIDLRLDVMSNEGGPYQLPLSLNVGGPIVSDAPVDIPDPGTGTSLIVVAQALTISALRVHVNIEHSWVGDLLVELQAPSGTRITLLDRPGIPPAGNGCGDDDMDVVFDDASVTNPEGRCVGSTPWLSGTARPVMLLSAFNGQSTAGTWRLIVTDAGTPDFGTILDWDLVTRPPLDPTCTTCAPVENCANGVDDDGDGAIDCADADCAGSPACVEGDCGDMIDNDGDGLTDCADSDCFNDLINCPPPELDCANGIDDDANTLIDCADPMCVGTPPCVETICADGIDNDGDGATDCADSDCAGGPPCLPENCANGIDDDGDGRIDCLDLDCLADPACAGSDYDGDGHSNATDCGPLDSQIWATPAEVPRDLRVTKAAGVGQIAWSSLASQAGPSTRYDVVSGQIGQLLADRSVTRATCRNDSLAATLTTDARTLGRPSDGYYYLVRGQNACVPGNGPYGSGSPPAPPRVPGSDCP